MTPFEIIIGIVGFIIATLLAFYVPGRIILGKVSLSSFQKLFISASIGIVLWAFQGIVFGYIHLRWLSYLYLLFCIIFYLKKRYFIELKLKMEWDLATFSIAALGIIAQVIPYIRMGWQTSQGIIISAHNTQDHIWHAALVSELLKRFPPNEPAISGVPLKDYHYFYNLAAADLIRVFHLPFFSTQFMGLYILAPILFAFVGYMLSQMIWNSKTFGRLVLFFLFFSGDAAGWVMLILRHSFTWNLSSLINDASKFMDSPPYGYAMVAGLTGLVLLLSFDKKMPKRILIICALLFGSLMEFKIYVGIPFLFAFGAYAFGNLFKKQIYPMISFLLAGSIAFILLKLGNSSSAGLIYLPVDIPRDFINQSILGLKDWQLRWVIYQDHHSFFRLVQYGFYMSFVYLLIQFGLQLFGIIPYRFALKKLGLSLSLFFYTGIFCAFILGLFFYQTVGGANIWEFFLAAAPLLSYLIAIFITWLITNKALLFRIIVILVVVAIVIPQWLISFTAYIKDEFLTPFHGISISQQQSFNYIATQTPKNSVVFLANQQGYSYASEANLFLDRDTYLAGNGVRQILTPEIVKRRNEVAILTSSKSPSDISSSIRNARVSYIYYYGIPENLSILKDIPQLHIVFANQAATIFKVN